MRLITENTYDYLQPLLVSLERDPLSLCGWQAVKISAPSQQNFLLKNLSQLPQIYGAHDGDVVRSCEGDILILSREMKRAELEQMCAFILQENEATPQFFDAYTDWRQLRAFVADLVLQSRRQSCGRPSVITPPVGIFGETSAMKGILDDARKRRKCRSPLHVLVVEDDPLTRRIIASCLKDDHALITATNAHEAVANYLIYAPDIVFLDIGLPDVDGFAALHEIVANDHDAYVVMLSANSYLDNVTAALNAGASGFIGKPFKRD
ncbi:MAG: response regulator, partial [Alphaproteobacteria bacterium]|nr:response regulator [Alphaproteobacteria bacterium]